MALITARRVILLGLAVATVCFLFFGSSEKIAPTVLLPGDMSAFENKIYKMRAETEKALKEQEAAAAKRFDSFNKKLSELETENRVLEKEIQRLRTPPQGSSLREKLAYTFPYETYKKFPAFIWQTWKDEITDETPESIRQPIRTWTEKNPSFVHEVLTDDAAAMFVQHLYAQIPEVVEAYKAMPKNILRADFFRYLVLLARGGVYSDVDTEDLKPIPNWIPDEVSPSTVGLIVGIEADPDRPDWKEWYARRIQLCQWTIQAKPGHPVLRDIVARIVEKTLAKQRGGTLELPGDKSDGSEIMDWTGPGVWTDAVFDYFNDRKKSGLKSQVGIKDFFNLKAPKHVSDVLVLPVTSFSPGVDQFGAKDTDDPLAFVKHLFSGSWKPEDERMNQNQPQVEA